MAGLGMDLSMFIACFLCRFMLFASTSSANAVFKVRHRFGGRHNSIAEFMDHDRRRHARILAAVDLPMGGSGHPSDNGLYYSKIGLGSPLKHYHVQVDTGSDILWVNCADCFTCPTKSDIGIELSLYDPQKSESRNMVTCDSKFCVETYSGPLPGCKPELNCRYKVVYGDGSSSSGYFVEDVLQFHQTSGDFQTKLANGTVVFGCGNKQDGGLGTSSEALDGIIGFGQANSSMISQLASSGRVRKMFSHCLDNVNGGGIFAIGEVVQPKPNMTSLVPNQPHYNVVMKSIDLGGNVIALHKGIFGFGNQQMTIIDSGTTLAYFPNDVYDLLISKIFSSHPDLKLETVQHQYKCFTYAGKIEEDFPSITLNFEGSLYLTVTPIEYLFQIMTNTWCVGWQSGSMQSNDGKEVIILGDLVLSNKLVIYDLENQTIGWTGYYNCSSSIKVKDEESGAVHLVGSHDISSVGGRAASTGVKYGCLMMMLLMCLLGSNHSHGNL